MSKIPHSKIVIFCNELQNFQHHRGDLVKGLIRSGFSVDLYATPVGSVETDLGLNFHPIEVRRFSFYPVSDFKLFLTVLRVLMREQPMTLYLLHLKPYLFGGLAAFIARRLGWRGKLVITVAGLGRLYAPESQVGLLRLRRRLVECFLRISTQDSTVTFETEDDKQQWIDRGLITEEQAIVLRGAGINLKRFPKRPKRSVTHLRVLFAGRLLRAKGLDVFMDAAMTLEKQRPKIPIEMMVAGVSEADPDSVNATKLVAHPNITYLGPVDDMPALLRETDVVVLPSRYNEGIPRILIEAAAVGCLIVATEFAGSRMLIRDAETGLFISGQDIEELSASLVTILLKVVATPELCDEYGSNASAFVRNAGFGATEITKQVAELLVGS